MHAWFFSVVLVLQAFSQSLVIGVVPDNLQENYSVPQKETISMKELRKRPTFIAPVIEASSGVAIDRTTGKVLFNREAYKKQQIASITKIMTALVTRERVTLEEVVTVSGDATRVEGSKMGLLSGEKITVQDLLHGLLIESGNDSAWALSEYVGGGNTEQFVKYMNEYAKRENLVNTEFSNPMGFDNKQNYSTAYEVYKMADLLLKDEFLRSVVSKDTVDIESITGQKHRLKSTNQILGGFLGIKGIKTGTTDQAGTSLVSLSTKDGRELIGVLLQSPDRFREMKIMLDWCYRAYINL